MRANQMSVLKCYIAITTKIIEVIMMMIVHRTCDRRMSDSS